MDPHFVPSLFLRSLRKAPEAAHISTQMVPTIDAGEGFLPTGRGCGPCRGRLLSTPSSSSSRSSGVGRIPATSPSWSPGSCPSTWAWSIGHAHPVSGLAAPSVQTNDNEGDISPISRAAPARGDGDGVSPGLSERPRVGPLPPVFLRGFCSGAWVPLLTQRSSSFLVLFPRPARTSLSMSWQRCWPSPW